MASHPMLESILALVAEHGWRIFPSMVIGDRKQPAIKGWPNVCSRDPEVIAGWWREYPKAIPSLVTGPRNGIVILDVDRGHNEDGSEYDGTDSLEEVFNWDSTPEVPCVHTRRGGRHFYFSCEKAPDDAILTDRHPMHSAAIKNSVSILAPHIDVRGWNGYVNLPVEGSGYWIDPILNFSLPMPPAPAWFNYRPLRKITQRDLHGRFDPQVYLADKCREIRALCGTGELRRHDAYRHAAFAVARLVGLGLLNESQAYNAIAGEIMALGRIRDGHTDRVRKYFDMAWSEGLADVAGKARR